MIKNRTRVPGSGALDAVLFCLGEAPGFEEDRTARPFVGRSGKLLRSTLAEICARLGVDSSLIWYTNCYQYRPPDNRTPTSEEIAEHLPWLKAEVNMVDPKCILALGATAKSVIYDLVTDAEFVGTWHPAYILRQHSKLDGWREDLEDAVRIAYSLPPRNSLNNEYDLSMNIPVPHDVETGKIWNNQFEWGMPNPDAKYLAMDTEFDDLEEAVGKPMVGWSTSDGQHGIFVPESICTYSFPHIYVHRADADLDNLGINPDDLSAYDDTILMAYPLQQKYGWPFLGLKRPDGKGLAQTICDPPVIWRNQLKSDLLRVWQPSGAVFKSGPRKGLEKPGKWKKNVQFSEVLRDRKAEAEEYGATDAFGTARLAERLEALLDENPWARNYYQQIEKPLVPVLLGMERTGVQIDTHALYAAGETIDAARARTEESIRAWPQFVGINIGSNQQIGPILLDLGMVDGKMTESGKDIAVGEDHILAAFGVDDWQLLPDTPEGRLAHDLLEWREMGKLRSTYVNGIRDRLDSSSRIHPRLNSTGAYTNRLSSSDPNEQNIPARSEIGMAIRAAFVAKPGYSFAGGDCSQLQLRIFGEMTHDPIFMDAYCGGSLRGCPTLCKCSICDVHQRFTDLVNSMGYHVERSSHTGGPSMKNGVFGTLYGAEGPKIAQTIGIPEKDAKRFIQQMRQAAPSVVTWPEVASQELSSQGYVETLVGWRMYMQDYGSVVDQWHKEAIRAAACGKVQGTEAGIMKACMTQIYRRLKEWPEAHLVLSVHDELWAEAPTDQCLDIAAMMKEVVETWSKQWMKMVPLVFDTKVIQNWAEGK